jgi:hypothetical protein
MPLSLPAASAAQYHSITRGLGVLRSAAVGTSGVDFDVTAWAGRIVLVTCAAECLGAWFTATAQTITDANSATAEASPAGSQLTNGFPLLAATHEAMLVPMPGPGELVILRVAAATGTTTVRIERASV